MMKAHRITGFCRVVADLNRAEQFYRDALGFCAVERGSLDPAVQTALGVQGEARCIVMRLGTQVIGLVNFARPGRPYPAGSQSNDLWFQHFAIAVDHMDAAYANLCGHAGWTAITDGSPQTLPPANGDVRAFKFRDPDGHPLELIWFPDRPRSGGATPFSGIDHSALAIAATDRSQAFYRRLGFEVAERSMNHGPAQARLDALCSPRLQVTLLRPALAASAGLELLAYDPPGRTNPSADPADMLTDWTTIAVTGGEALPRVMRDPDGHLLVLVDQGTGSPACGPVT